MRSTAFLLLTIPLLASACAEHEPDRNVIRAHKRMLQQRQAASSAPAPTPASSVAASVPVASGSAPVAGTSGAATAGAPSGTVAPVPTGPVPTDPFATIPLSEIVSGAPTELTAPLQTTYAAGAQPPISGAPALPSLTITYTTYPPANTVPPTDSPQVKEWLKEIEGVDPAILAIKPTVDGSCGSDPAAVADTSRCWWTCGGCTNSTSDVVTCPDKNTWGLSFDDGPSPYSPKVLKFLGEKELKGTFFIVGSRVIERPQVLQAEYMEGHQISVHTWSHSIPLTALTNEQIVAELGWSRQAIAETIGVTPITMRPPWGDIDNRVRAISMAMGLRPIIWTRDPTTLAQFDTNDWKVPAGTVTGEQSLAQFQTILTNATKLDTGFIVLQHDLWQQNVDLSTGYTIPAAIQAGFKLEDINTCQKNEPADAYLETVTDKSKVPTYPNAGGTTASNGGPGSSSSPGANAGAAQGSNTSGASSRFISGLSLSVTCVLASMALIAM